MRHMETGEALCRAWDLVEGRAPMNLCFQACSNEISFDQMLLLEALLDHYCEPVCNEDGPVPLGETR